MTKPGGGRGGSRGGVERCAFCDSSKHEVDKLIAGKPSVFICNRCVEICHRILRDESGPDAPPPLFLEQIPTPKVLKAKLDEHIIGQEHAKKVLSVAVHNHYKRLILSGRTKHEVEVEKSNILMIGPTGCGKTALARTLAKILNVPFAIGDATTLTEAGYVGEDVENLLLKLLQAADWDKERAERGIIFVDEIDKIARTQNNVSITRDVSGEGVQQALLKILEGTVANVPPQGGRKHPEQQYIQMDTTNILFLCGGTFVGLEDIVRRRVGRKVIGFDADASGPDDAAVTEALRRLEPHDLFEYGMIPEFVGRLPVVATLAPLGREDLVRVMTEPRNAIVRQYAKVFEMSGCELEFTPDALAEIADMCIAKGTGVRAVRSIVEERLLDVLFDLPTDRPGTRYVVTREAVRGEAKLLETPLARVPSVRRKRETA
jgi:ATP-dependent Clp protease ATP-binding subunit ClpX